MATIRIQAYHVYYVITFFVEERTGSDVVHQMSLDEHKFKQTEIQMYNKSSIAMRYEN
jgi:hypothetical protein